PDCGTVFRVTAAELRVAGGFVRCGHCSTVFNALATLSESLPPELERPPEDDAGTAPPPDAARGHPDDDSEVPGGEASAEPAGVRFAARALADEDASGEADDVPLTGSTDEVEVRPPSGALTAEDWLAGTDSDEPDEEEIASA